MQLTALQDTNKTDWLAFANKCGKILMAHNAHNAHYAHYAHDALVSPRTTQQYWQRIRASMGPAKVHIFARYFEIADDGHAVSSVCNAAWD